jgi:hypothetical protein
LEQWVFSKQLNLLHIQIPLLHFHGFIFSSPNAVNLCWFNLYNPNACLFWTQKSIPMKFSLDSIHCNNKSSPFVKYGAWQSYLIVYLKLAW